MRRRVAELPVAQQLVLALVAALALGALTVGVPVLNSAGLILASIALVAALAVLSQWLWQARGATDWTHTFTSTPRARGTDLRITRIAGDVQAAASGGDPAAAARLHDFLGSLAADQLRLRRGLSLAEQPEEAHAALGPDLTAYLTQPPPARLDGTRLEAFTTTLEEL